MMSETQEVKDEKEALLTQQEHITIDGSYGEGGGRMFRDSLMYAATKCLKGWQGKLTIKNIRMRRPKPGLKNSLIGMLEVCQQMFSHLALEGNEESSPEVTVDFKNAVLRTTDDTVKIDVDIHGIGSAWLLFLAVHPVLNALSSSIMFECTIHGGTDVCFKKSQKNPDTLTPPTIYMRDVWLTNINTLDIGSMRGRAMAIGVNIVRHHRDKESKPYAIKITSIEDDKLPSVMEIKGLRDNFDGCIKLATSTVSGLVIGSSHPYAKFELNTDCKLDEPCATDYCDKHFADMVIPYLDPRHELMNEMTCVSEHHRSAIYVRRMFSSE
jgi:hypothetical protein